MAHTLDTHRTEVHRQHVEGGFCAALNGRGDQRGKAVDALGLHGFDQHGARCAAGERLDQRGGQRFDKARIPTEHLDQPANTVEAEFQGARCA